MITYLIAFLLIPSMATGVTLTSVDTDKIKDVTLVTIYGDDTLRMDIGYPTIKPNVTRIVMDVTNIQGYSVLERDTSITVGIVPLHVEKLYPKEIAKLRKAPLITLDLTNADIRNVLKMLADRYNLNIVISEAVTGFITVHLKKVTPLEAFQSILQAAGCTFVESEGILIVKPLAETQTIEMDTRIFKLEHLDATDAKESIKNLLSLY